ncbi:hypothetical protein ECZU36_26210 [Escherichia coli]|nr:hypothetical protein ECZU36_26210 [Escherichia coli]
MITLPPKRGMALVVVLVLLAVMMLVTITLSGRMQQQLGRTRSQQEYQQALWYSASAESGVERTQSEPENGACIWHNRGLLARVFSCRRGKLPSLCVTHRPALT